MIKVISFVGVLLKMILLIFSLLLLQSSKSNPPARSSLHAICHAELPEKRFPPAPPGFSSNTSKFIVSAIVSAAELWPVGLKEIVVLVLIIKITHLFYLPLCIMQAKKIIFA